MKKQLSIYLLAFIIAVAFLPAPAFASAKVKMTVYDQVIKTGNTVYCPAEGDGIYKVKLRRQRVQDVKRLVKTGFIEGGYSYNDSMKKKGKYLYYVQGSEGTYWELHRVNVSTGKKQRIAVNAIDYAIKKNRIYAAIAKITDDKEYTVYRSMKLNGKNKKKTSTKPSMKHKKTNAAGYSVKYMGHETYDENGYKYVDYVKTYLKTPKGMYYLGESWVY